MYAVRRFIAVYPMNPGHKRVNAVHGDESPNAIKSGPYWKKAVFRSNVGCRHFALYRLSERLSLGLLCAMFV